MPRTFPRFPTNIHITHVFLKCHSNSNLPNLLTLFPSYIQEGCYPTAEDLLNKLQSDWDAKKCSTSEFSKKWESENSVQEGQSGR